MCPTHTRRTTAQTQTAALEKASDSSASLNGLNLTALLNGTTGSSSVATGALAEQLDEMDRQIKTLQSVAIAGVIFGVFGVAMALFAACRVFVVSTVSPGGAALVTSTASGASGGSVRAGGGFGAAHSGGSVRGVKMDAPDNMLKPLV